MPRKEPIPLPLRIQGYAPDGTARAWWKPYLGNHDPELALREDFLYLDPRFHAPGDLVEAEYIGKKGGLFQGKQRKLQEPSPLRRTPPCPHFGICGGCTLQHLPPRIQQTVKENMVRECLMDSAGNAEFLPLLPAAAETGYRNKIECTASARPWLSEPGMDRFGESLSLGYFVPYSGNKVLDVRTCLLQPEEGNRILAWFHDHSRQRGWSHYNHHTHEGFFRTLLIRTLPDGQILVMPVFAIDDHDEIPHCLETLRRDIPGITSLWYLVNPKMNDTYADLEPVHHSGTRFLVENLDGIDFGIGPRTFFQVNSAQCRVLYARVMELARLDRNQSVWDLYCGVGTMTCLAALRARHAVGVEYVEESVALARHHAGQAGITNAVFHAGDMKDLLDDAFLAREGVPDCVICDPPRAGLHPQVARFLARLEAKRMVYVSCNMESLRRDLALLGTTWTVTLVQGVDLMPQTPHVEVIALLEKNP